jgi:penicillin amidase
MVKPGKASLLARVIVAFAALAGLVVATAWWGLRSSLPLLEGEIWASGLHSPVVVARDLWSVPTIEAQDCNDAAYAEGV